MDFTLHIYEELLRSLLENGYQFVPFEKYNLQAVHAKTVILRHDVDIRPANSYKTALIEKSLGIEGTYYFRIVKQSFIEKYIKKIAALGHEIGYHYEDLALANGDIEKAIQLFEMHLKRFANLYPVKTICMHGSPLSRYDNRLLWQKYRYTDFGNLSEPYFDIDFSQVLYLTDTGRRWDGDKVSVRDKAPKSVSAPLSDAYKFKTTTDIIEAARLGRLPDKIMLNFHPQRWSDDMVGWSKELILQGLKNQLKRVIVKRMTDFQIRNHQLNHL
jgi:hypothetical protein